jgi:predicted ATP-grasp superfamily ATP-dependent carboligase
MLKEEHLNATARLFEIKEEVNGLAKSPKRMMMVDHNDVILICEYIDLLRKSGEDMLNVVTDFTAALNNVRSIVKSGGTREAVASEVDGVLARHNFEGVSEN